MSEQASRRAGYLLRHARRSAVQLCLRRDYRGDRRQAFSVTMPAPLNDAALLAKRAEVQKVTSLATCLLPSLRTPVLRKLRIRAAALLRWWRTLVSFGFGGSGLARRRMGPPSPWFMISKSVATRAFFGTAFERKFGADVVNCLYPRAADQCEGASANFKGRISHLTCRCGVDHEP